nr:MAG TPA: hypothetical protein [Caudoviricetes sp.]
MCAKCMVHYLQKDELIVNGKTVHSEMTKQSILNCLTRREWRRNNEN